MTEKIYYTYEDFPLDKLQLYAGIDCIVTTGLIGRLFGRIVDTPQYTFVNGKHSSRGKAKSILEVNETLGHKAFEFICDLEINGLMYDVERNRRFNNQMITEISTLEDKIRSKVPSNFNFNSAKDITTYLYGSTAEGGLGLTVGSTTKNGDPAVDGEALLALSEKYSLEHLAWMARRKDIDSVHRTFISTYIDDFVKRDGRIHPNYNLHGTSSFRITGDNPNLTQLPRPKHGYNVRECYITPSGTIFMAFDFSSAEVKVLGALCRDPKLLEAIREGKDFHSVSASSMRGIPYEEFVAVLEDKTNPNFKKYKNWRQEAKALTFGILYGSSAAGIAMNLGISREEAERLINMYFTMFPLIRKYVEDTHRMAIENHYVMTPFGRRKMEFGTLPVFKGSACWNAALRNSQNVRVQSTTSDVGLFVFSEANRRVKKLGAKCICTVYDSLEIECPIEKAAEVLETVFYCMDDYPSEVFPWLDFNIGCEAEIGTNWGNAVTVHRGTTQEDINSIIGGLAA